MDIIIRKAFPNDMMYVLELIKELAVFEKEPDAVEVTVDDLKRDGFGKNPLFTCFIAEVSNEIVGTAICYFRYSTWKGQTVHLEDLIVKNAMRGKGVGAALYSEVINFGFELGVKRIEWNVLDWNEGAIKFYERTGAKVLKDWATVQMDEEGINNYIESK